MRHVIRTMRARRWRKYVQEQCGISRSEHWVRIDR